MSLDKCTSLNVDEDESLYQELSDFYTDHTIIIKVLSLDQLLGRTDLTSEQKSILSQHYLKDSIDLQMNVLTYLLGINSNKITRLREPCEMNYVEED